MTDEKDLIELVGEISPQAKPMSLADMKANVEQDIRNRSINLLTELLADDGFDKNSPMYRVTMGILCSTESSYAFSKTDISEISRFFFTKYYTVMEIEESRRLDMAMVVFMSRVMSYFFEKASMYFVDSVVVELIQSIYRKVSTKLGRMVNLTYDEAYSLMKRGIWSGRLRDDSMFFQENITQLDILVDNENVYELDQYYDGPTLIAAFIMRKILKMDPLLLPATASKETSVIVKEYHSNFESVYSLNSEEFLSGILANNPEDSEDTAREKFSIREKFAISEENSKIVIESLAFLLSSIMDELIKFAIDIRYRLNEVELIKSLLMNIHSEVFANADADDSSELISTVVDAFELLELFDKYGDNLDTVMTDIVTNVPE